MAVVQSFPLLHLPFVPFNEVISFMQPIDQFWLSLLSKKTMQLVKSKHILNLEVASKQFDSVYHITCNNQDGSVFSTIAIADISRKSAYSSYTVLQRLNFMYVPMNIKNGSVLTFWKDLFEGFQKMTSILCDIFKIQNVSIEFHVNHEEELNKAFELIQRLQTESNINLRKLKMTGYTRNSFMYGNILKKCINVPELTIFSQELRYQHNMNQPNEESYFEELCADWLALENINLIIKCKRIKLWDLEWTSQEMNKFLKLWIESSMMKTVELTVKNADIQIAVEGLQVTPQEKNLSFLGLPRELTDCFEIHRSYGVNANIWSYEGKLIMKTYR